MAHAQICSFPGRGIIWNRLKGNGTEPKNIGWGSSSVTGSANANVNLFKPESENRTVGTSTLMSTSFLADTYQVVGSIVAAGNKTITEAGLFDTTTLSPTTTLAASLTASAVAMTLGSSSGLPTTGNYYAQIENETVLVAGAASTTLTITRGRLGSTSAVHASGVPFTPGADGGAAGSGATSEQTATMAAAQGGSLFDKADFDGIALSTSDSINFTWQHQLTGA